MSLKHHEQELYIDTEPHHFFRCLCSSDDPTEVSLITPQLSRDQQDPTHPQHALFTLLPSGWRYRSVKNSLHLTASQSWTVWRTYDHRLPHNHRFAHIPLLHTRTYPYSTLLLFVYICIHYVFIPSQCVLCISMTVTKWLLFLTFVLAFLVGSYGNDPGRVVRLI